MLYKLKLKKIKVLDTGEMLIRMSSCYMWYESYLFLFQFCENVLP